MRICQVVGSIVSTVKNHNLLNEKLLLVQPLDLDGRPNGGELIAIDDVDAGIGDKVLVIFEGRAARDIRHKTVFPVRAVIVGVIDGIDIAIPADGAGT